MNIRLFNARILTMEENRPVFCGEIWIQNETILYVGDGKDKAAVYGKQGIDGMRWDVETDCEGNLLMPGFKNAHTHSGMTLLRSYADDLPLQEWLTKRVFPIEAKMTGEDIYTLTKLAVLEYLTSGITAIFDMYLTPDTIAAACDEMGMRCVQVGAVNDFSQSPEYIEELFLKLNAGSSLQSYMLGFHAEYTCSKELLERIAELSHKYQAPVFTHMSETKAEVEGCIERYGMTPTAFLHSLGIFDYGGGGYHCVHMTAEDIRIMKENNLFAVINPGSNTKLASGIPPVSDFLRAGVRVAIGTDGPASNNCLDMFREMFLATGLAKLKEEDAAAVDANCVLQMATVNGAHAMGLGQSDVLAEGKLADIIMIDLNQPNMQPIHNISKNIVYSGSKQNIKMTMINGKVRYKDGVFYGKDKPEDLYRKANEIAKRMM